MTSALVIALSTTASGAASVVVAESADSRAQAAAASVSAPVLSGENRSALPRACSARKAVRFYSRRLNEHRVRMGAPAQRLPARSLTGCPRYLAAVWKRRAAIARKQYELWFATLYEKWRCLHEHEGAWNANTGNGYWGGLQMDWGFQHTYGPEFIRRYGLANRWPVWAQLIAAERAYHGFAGFGGRGYSPWGTASACGLR